MEKLNEIPVIDLYSDGGAEPNPGNGGFGIILSWRGKRKEFSQGYQLTTNNRMELLGVITGLERLKTQSIVNVYTDSRYVIDGIEKGWAEKWKSNNWYRTKQEKAINSDLWSRLLDLIYKHDVKFHWVKGHNGHPENERCDVLATKAIQSANLLNDEGFENIQRPSYFADKEPNKVENKTKAKITQEGDLCRHCNTPVIKRSVNHKKIKANQAYYFQYYMYCPECKAMYMVEAAKKYISSADVPSDRRGMDATLFTISCDSDL